MRKEKTTAKRDFNVITPENKEDINILNSLIIPAWETALDETTKQEAQFIIEQFSKYSGATKQAPITFMFYGFNLGIAQGMKIQQALEQGEKAE